MRVLLPSEKPMPEAVRLAVERIGENCEPALCTVLFMGGAGGSLRAGVTENPVNLTRSVRQALTRVTCGGAPVYVWPGGGITFMVDVSRLPRHAFGYVPTPALVAPIEFTMRARRLCRAWRPYGLCARCRGTAGRSVNKRIDSAAGDNPWPLAARGLSVTGPTGRRLADAAGCISSMGRSISSSRRMEPADAGRTRA